MGKEGRQITPGEMLSAKAQEEARMTDLILHQVAAAEKKKRNTPRETPQIMQEQGQKAQEILEKIEAGFQKYDISQAIQRAEKKGVTIPDTVDEAYAQIFGEDKRLRSDEETNILKNELMQAVLRRFEPFLPAFNAIEEKEIESLMEELEDRRKIKIKKELVDLEDAHTLSVEEKMKALIEPYLAAKMIVGKHEDDTPGLLQIPNQEKKKRGFSGIFKGLFNR